MQLGKKKNRLEESPIQFFRAQSSMVFSKSFAYLPLLISVKGFIYSLLFVCFGQYLSLIVQINQHTIVLLFWPERIFHYTWTSYPNVLLKRLVYQFRVAIWNSGQIGVQKVEWIFFYSRSILFCLLFLCLVSIW